MKNYFEIYVLHLLIIHTFFLLDVLHYKMDQAGFLAAVPYLLMAVIVQSAGVLADLARTRGRLSTTQVKSYHCVFSIKRL